MSSALHPQPGLETNGSQTQDDGVGIYIYISKTRLKRKLYSSEEASLIGYFLSRRLHFYSVTVSHK